MQTSLLWRFSSDSASHGHVWALSVSCFCKPNSVRELIFVVFVIK